MALMTTCLCCSLLSAAIMAGVLSTFLYSVAFALELWWILEAKVSLSVPAYILAGGYALMAILSLLLLLGLRTKRTKFLLGWVLLMVLYIFPEAGLVLFMAIYHWNGKTYGIIELSLWALRVVFNVFGIVAVQSLWSSWRDEKSVFRSLQELSNTNGGVVSGGLAENGLGIPGNHKLRGSLRYQNGLVGYTESYQNGGYTNGGYRNGGFNHASYQNGGYPVGSGFQNGGYQNSGYDEGGPSPSRISGSLAITRLTSHDSANLKRSSSAGSGFVSASRLGTGYPQAEFSPTAFHRSQSQFELPSFGLDPDAPIFLQGGYGPGGLPVNIYRGNSRRDKLLSERLEWYRPRSLGNLAVDLDTVSVWSEKYRDLEGSLSHGFDGRYRAASLGNLNLGYRDSDWREREHRIGSKHSLGQVSGVSDNPERYGDIAL